MISPLLSRYVRLLWTILFVGFIVPDFRHRPSPRFAEGKTVATTPLGVGFDFEENREIEATLLLLLSLFISVCYYLSLSLSKQGQKSCGYRPPYPSSLFPFLFFFLLQTLDTSFSTKVDATNDSLLKGFLPRHFTFRINRLDDLGGIQGWSCRI